MELIKVNFGCGPVQPDGWINIDNDEQFNTSCRDITELLQTHSDEIDLIVAHHSLQTVPYDAMDDVLYSMRQLLKSGGELFISIPDIKAAYDAYLNNDISWFPIMNDEPIDERFCHYLTWYGQNINPLTAKSLLDALSVHGFNAEQTYPKQDDKSNKKLLMTRLNESIFVKATK